jgi:hypothetical protein
VQLSICHVVHPWAQIKSRQLRARHPHIGVYMDKSTFLLTFDIVISPDHVDGMLLLPWATDCVSLPDFILLRSMIAFPIRN